MAQASITDTDFAHLFETLGAAGVAKRIGRGIRNVYYLRRNVEKRLGRSLATPNQKNIDPAQVLPAAPPAHRFTHAVWDGCVLIGSDAHYWPNIVTTAHRAFVHFTKRLKPEMVILNGDVLDGASISRHAPIGWETRPSLIQEIEACQERLTEIEKAAKNAKLVWTLGNHDARFETRLATVAPEFARVHGVHLKDHFPLWHPAWACWIGDQAVVKHRMRSGIHAPWNSTMNAGKTIVTGHLHSLKVVPLTDYNGTRWGVDCGTLAEPGGPQFVDYLEDNPTNWRSGFIVLTFRGGKLLDPEIVRVLGDGQVSFRGEVVDV